MKHLLQKHYVTITLHILSALPGTEFVSIFSISVYFNTPNYDSVPTESVSVVTKVRFGTQRIRFGTQRVRFGMHESPFRSVPVRFGPFPYPESPFLYSESPFLYPRKSVSVRSGPFGSVPVRFGPFRSVSVNRDTGH